MLVKVDKEKYDEFIEMLNRHGLKEDRNFQNGTVRLWTKLGEIPRILAKMEIKNPESPEHSIAYSYFIESEPIDSTDFW